MTVEKMNHREFAAFCMSHFEVDGPYRCCEKLFHVNPDILLKLQKHAPRISVSERNNITLSDKHGNVSTISNGTSFMFMNGTLYIDSNN